MTQALLNVGKVYDLIVIDSPPLLLSYAVPLLSKVGGVLVVSRVGVTTRDAAAMLRDQLRALHAPVLGLIANGVKSGPGHYGYFSSPLGQSPDPRPAGDFDTGSDHSAEPGVEAGASGGESW
jgi:Mrp family chromosome partitioning ATPase